MTQTQLNSKWHPMDKRIDEIANAERVALYAHWQLGNLKKAPAKPMALYEKRAIELTKNQWLNAIKSLIGDYPEIADAWACLREYQS